jgi:vitamin B12 transport system substrate-binding protein
LTNSFLFKFAWAFLLIVSATHTKSSDISVPNGIANDATLRIVTLSPHLTEIVFALGLGEQVVAVSDFSDYPEQANTLPSVASYQGANIPEILRLRATHVLAWKGGNKDADISKLQSNGVALYLSSIQDSDSLIADIRNIGKFLGVQNAAEALAKKLEQQKNTLVQSYKGQHRSVFYYLNSTPLVALGKDAWLNDLLSMCGLYNVFADSPAPYPQVSIEQVLRQAPQVIVSANSNASEPAQRWSAHQTLLQARYIKANPDKLHRFTPRALNEITWLCEHAHANL